VIRARESNPPMHAPLLFPDSKGFECRNRDGSPLPADTRTVRQHLCHIAKFDRICSPFCHLRLIYEMLWRRCLHHFHTKPRKEKPKWLWLYCCYRRALRVEARRETRLGVRYVRARWERCLSAALASRRIAAGPAC
jgi:hypothetical protein